MSVTLRGVTLYSASEVSAMTPTGTIDSQWETYELTGINGWTSTSYNLGKFHVNKITGLVTGEIGISNRTATNPTSTTYGSNTNLGIHSGMMIKYPGAFEYLITKGSPTAAQILNGRELNTTISTTGDFTLQGRGWSTTTIPNISDFLETFAYIGSKYGKIYTQEYAPIYLKEGAFYRQETVDLITGHAWLKFNVTLPTGYDTSNSYVVGYKNLWSGEIILQYSLHPTTTGTMPAITLPERLAVVNGRHFYTDIRYCDPATTYAGRHSCWMRVTDHTLTFNPIAGQTWATGSLFYQGNEESNPHGNGQETVIGLWLPESSQAIPSVNNAKFPRLNTNSFAVTSLDPYLPTSKFTPRTADPSWASNNYRSGMVFFYWDMNMKAATMPSPFTSSEWSQHWIPSYRYNVTSGTQISLYCNGVQYLSNLDPSYATGNSAWTCNVYTRTGKALGADPGTGNKVWNFGTTGEMTSATAGLACFNGYYLSNNGGNIIQ